MKATIIDHCISINVSELLDDLEGDEKLSLIDTLACQNEVIDFVMQQVLEGWTELGSHGPKGCIAYASPLSGIDKARRDISKASGEIASKEISRLEEALVKVTKERQEIAEELFSLRHSFSSL